MKEPSATRVLVIVLDAAESSLIEQWMQDGSLPNLRNPAAIWIIPASMTVAKMYSMPCDFASATITTATAPVAPEIIPGRPPRMEVTRPITKAA